MKQSFKSEQKHHSFLSFPQFMSTHSFPNYLDAVLVECKTISEYYHKILAIISNNQLQDSYGEKAIEKLKNIIASWPFPQKQKQSAENLTLQNAIDLKLQMLKIICNSTQKRPLIKNLKKIASQIFRKQVQNPQNFSTILNHLNSLSSQSKKISICEYLLLLCQGFELCLEINSKTIFKRLSQIICCILKKINSNLKQINQYERIRVQYYTMKILCAIFKYQTDQTITQLFKYWLPKILDYFTSFLQVKQPVFICQIDYRSDQYFYFHAKKWALKALNIAVNNNCIFFNSNQQDQIHNWFSQYKKPVLEIILRYLNNSYASKLQVLSLKILNKYSIYQTQLIFEHIRNLQQNVLPKFLLIPQFKKMFYIQEPNEYFQQVESSLLEYQFKIGPQLWTNLLKIQISKNKDGSQMIVSRCFSQIIGYIVSDNNQDYQRGLVLLNYNKHIFIKYPYLMEKLSSGIEGHIEKFISCDDVIIQAYTFTFIEKYCEIWKQQRMIKFLNEKILEIFQSFSCNFIKIKAFKTLFKLIQIHKIQFLQFQKHQILRETFALTKQTMQTTLIEQTAYLIKQFYPQGITSQQKAAQYIFVDAFHDICQEIQQKDKIYFDNEDEDEDDYYSLTENVSDLMKSIVLVLNSQGIESIQEDIICMIKLFFKYNELLNNRQPLRLIRDYIKKIPTQNTNFLFLLPCILRKFYPISSSLRKKICQNDIIFTNNKQQLLQQMHCVKDQLDYNTGIAELGGEILKKYSKYISENQTIYECVNKLIVQCLKNQINHNSLTTPIIQIILNNYILVFSSVILADNLPFLCEYIYRASKKRRSQSIMKLYCAILWKFGGQVIKIMQQSQSLDVEYMFFYLIKGLNLVVTPQTKKISILGLTSFLQMPKTNKSLLKCWKAIISILLNSINHTCDEKITSINPQLKQIHKQFINKQNKNIKVDEEQQQQSSYLQSIEDSIVEQQKLQRNNKYWFYQEESQTQFENINQLQHFLKQFTIFREEQKQFSQETIRDITEEHIEKLIQKIDMAISYLQQQSKKCIKHTMCEDLKNINER